MAKNKQDERQTREGKAVNRGARKKTHTRIRFTTINNAEITANEFALARTNAHSTGVLGLTRCVLRARFTITTTLFLRFSLFPR